MEGAKSKEDIIAFPERFIKNGNGIITISRPKFGSSSHIGSIILTTINHDPVKKAAMNIKYAPKIITACKKLNLSVSSFSRRLEPNPVKRKEGNTLEWGAEQAIKKFGSVPNIIYDTGEMGKEAMIRVLDSNPISLAKIILKIKAEYIKTRKLPHSHKKKIKF
jgi:hydroxymethylpyrimidine/phosphomethylpyrimidine kinase